MYTGHTSQGQGTNEWIDKTDAFLERAFGWLLKERVKFVVPAANMQIEKDKRRRSWGNIFGRMDL